MSTEEMEVLKIKKQAANCIHAVAKIASESIFCALVAVKTFQQNNLNDVAESVVIDSLGKSFGFTAAAMAAAKMADTSSAASGALYAIAHAHDAWENMKDLHCEFEVVAEALEQGSAAADVSYMAASEFYSEVIGATGMDALVSVGKCLAEVADVWSKALEVVEKLEADSDTEKNALVEVTLAIRKVTDMASTAADSAAIGIKSFT